jgi:hypothetical protein
MARRFKNSLAGRALALALPLLGAPLLASCVDDSASLRVECSIIPEVNDNVCVFDPGGDCLLEGRLNILAATYYHGTLRLTNGLRARARNIPVQAETNGIDVREFEVEVLNTAGGRIKFTNLPNPFTVKTSGWIPVGGSGVASGEFLPTGYVNQIKAAEMGTNPLGQIVVSVIVRGKTQGDVDVETAPWHWPIRLFQINPNDRDECQLFDEGICNFGQDDYVAACRDQTPT